MFTDGLDDLTFFINLDFSLAFTIFFAIVATPISSNFFTNILSMKLEAFVIDCAVETGILILLVAIHN